VIALSGNPTVLIVDDDDIYLSIAKAMVKKMGYHVLTASDGIEALSIFEEHRDKVDCILLDIQMPRMNGIVTLQNLRKISEDVKVIIVSGYVTDEYRKKLDPLRPLEYLNKPIGYQDFAGKLNKYVPLE
jgi:CheY-like chemotaxis protein